MEMVSVELPMGSDDGLLGDRGLVKCTHECSKRDSWVLALEELERGKRKPQTIHVVFSRMLVADCS